MDSEQGKLWGSLWGANGSVTLRNDVCCLPLVLLPSAHQPGGWVGKEPICSVCREIESGQHQAKPRCIPWPSTTHLGAEFQSYILEFYPPEYWNHTLSLRHLLLHIKEVSSSRKHPFTQFPTGLTSCLVFLVLGACSDQQQRNKEKADASHNCSANELQLRGCQDSVFRWWLLGKMPRLPGSRRHQSDLGRLDTLQVCSERNCESG